MEKEIHDFWVAHYKKIDKATYVEWVKEFLDISDFDNAKWLSEIHENDYYLYIEIDTLLLNVDFLEPPAWIVLKVFNYIYGKI